MAFRLGGKFDSVQKIKAENILRDGALDGLSSTAIINKLRDQGLSYRRTNMLRDVRRSRAVSFAKTPDNTVKAVTWYDEVFESFQETNDLTPRAATELWKKTIDQSWDTLEEAELGVQWQDLYDDLFK